MSKRKKIYVTSGDMQVVLEADGPIGAIKTALKRANGATLDSDFIYLDERGFRHDDTAQYKVPVEQALAEAGYFFQDPTEDEGCGTRPPETHGDLDFLAEE